MIVPRHGMLAAARLRKQVAGVRRVVIARTDGIALYDDVPLEERDSAAALTATVLGLAEVSSASFALGEQFFTFTMSADGCLFVLPIDDGHLLAIVGEPQLDTVALVTAAEAEATSLRHVAAAQVSQ